MKILVRNLIRYVHCLRKPMELNNFSSYVIKSSFPNSFLQKRITSKPTKLLLLNGESEITSTIGTVSEWLDTTVSFLFGRWSLTSTVRESIHLPFPRLLLFFGGVKEATMSPYSEYHGILATLWAQAGIVCRSSTWTREVKPHSLESIGSVALLRDIFQSSGSRLVCGNLAFLASFRISSDCFCTSTNVLDESFAVSS